MIKKSNLITTSGITLVALVVTIVVLLILAGFTLVYIFGENGVFEKAQDAKDKTEQAKQNEQEYIGNLDNDIDNYINKNDVSGTTNPPDVPDTPEGPTISDSTSTSHTATEIDYTWEQISKIAEAIAKSDSVNNETMEVKANIDGTECIIGVGDIARVSYTTPATETTEAKTESRRVRVLGFKHDELVNTSAYGSETTAIKASISFEFLDFMTGNTYKNMNSNNDTTGGWAATQMRKDLNGYTTNDDAQSGSIGGLGANLSNKEYIKLIKKQYIKKYDAASSNQNYTQDYLWLLAASEVVPQNSENTRYANAITTEGSQYQYYQGVTKAWNTGSEGRKKYNASDSADYWWLRSPVCINSGTFCGVNMNGDVNTSLGVNASFGVSPGFSI